MCFFDCCIPKPSAGYKKVDDELDKISEQFELIRRNTIMRNNKVVNDFTHRAKKRSGSNTMYDNDVSSLLKSRR